MTQIKNSDYAIFLSQHAQQTSKCLQKAQAEKSINSYENRWNLEQKI